MTDQIDHRATFLDQFEALQAFALFHKMGQTVEGSPWHREANVLVHTNMVVNEYVKATDAAVTKWSHDDYLGAMSCAWHDTGKPDAKIEKFSEGRGKYFAFHGHELISAHHFENYAVSRGWFTPEDIYKVCWMIENHMPWSLEDKGKRRHMALTANMTVGSTIYTRALMADQMGRIADDNETKVRAAQDWVDTFLVLCVSPEVLITLPECKFKTSLFG